MLAGWINKEQQPISLPKPNRMPTYHLSFYPVSKISKTDIILRSIKNNVPDRLRFVQMGILWFLTEHFTSLQFFTLCVACVYGIIFQLVLLWEFAIFRISNDTVNIING